MKGICAHILIPDRLSSFPTRRMVGEGRPLVPEIVGQTDPAGTKKADFQSTFARSASAVRPSEKSSLRAFH